MNINAVDLTGNTKFVDVKTIDPYVIYIAMNDDHVFGVAKAIVGKRPVIFEHAVPRGEQHDWQGGLKKDDGRKRKMLPADFRAEKEIKILLSNSLNAVRLYGENVLTNGEIDLHKYRQCEYKALQSDALNKMNPDLAHPLYKYKVVHATYRSIDKLV